MRIPNNKPYQGWRLQPFCKEGKYYEALQFAKEAKLMAKAEYRREKRNRQAYEEMLNPTMPKGKTLKQLITEGKTFGIKRRPKAD